jgi:hypothetical protein
MSMSKGSDQNEQLALSGTAGGADRLLHDAE